MQEPSEILVESEMTSNTVRLNSTRTDSNAHPSTTGENGNVFTLTNIYTFGVNGKTNVNGSNDKHQMNSFVEVFDQPSSSGQDHEYERYHQERYSSSSSVTRKIQTSSIDKCDYQLTNTSRTGSEDAKEIEDDCRFFVSSFNVFNLLLSACFLVI